MKKLVALICAIAMMVVMGVPAFANPSIDAPAPVVEATIVVGDSEYNIVAGPVDKANPDVFEKNGEALADVVDTINSKEDGKSITPAKVAEVVEKAGGDVIVPEGVNVSKLHLVSPVVMLEVKGDMEATKAIKNITVPVKFADLNADNYQNYMIQLLGIDGNLYYIPLEYAGGEFLATFPCCGYFGLVQIG